MQVVVRHRTSYEVHSLLQEILDALKYLHDRNVMHRWLLVAGSGRWCTGKVGHMESEAWRTGYSEANTSGLKCSQEYDT